MIKRIIRIPAGIKYIGDNVFKEKMPGFQFRTGIYAKEMTGCGATTFALKEDKMNVVLLVPRKTLLWNKAEQTPDCQQVYGDIGNDEIKNYVDSHRGNRKVFICTYDSAARLRRLLGDTWEGYHVYVDEFHVLLSDASFKSYVEMALIDTVSDAEHQTWISATPCLDMFIERMPHLSALPFYQMDWEEKEQMDLQKIWVKQPEDALLKTVRMYQKGNYPTLTMDDGTRVESKTMNGFLSSVNGILNIVKQCGLTPENTDIVCSETEDNKDALRKMGFEIGKVPGKGERRKMFTLCTSTAYMGMDFYGEDTLTVVCANCKRVNTAVDIETELVQICGRERLDENPFRKVILFFHNDWDGASELEERLEEIERKRLVSEELNSIMNQPDISPEARVRFQEMVKLEKKAMGDAKGYSYWDEEKGRFEMNQLSILSDEYEVRVQHHIYQNGMVVRKSLEGNFHVTERTCDIKEHVKNLALKTTFADKMKAYCELRQSQETNGINPFSFEDYEISQMERNDSKLRVYYDELGPERIKANSYQENRLQEELNVKKSDVRIRVALDKLLPRGEWKTTQEWKTLMNKVYQQLGIQKKGVRTHLTDIYGYKMEKKTPRDDFGKRTELWRIVG
ncbi:MAG: DEAD/DEAH box helicase family protein [Bacteroidaceae bacterium]|nr:DEAD/DEAH box helicase family protein [Bacteroidaceae bacterium]